MTSPSTRIEKKIRPIKSKHGIQGQLLLSQVRSFGHFQTLVPLWASHNEPPFALRIPGIGEGQCSWKYREWTHTRLRWVWVWINSKLQLPASQFSSLLLPLFLFLPLPPFPVFLTALHLSICGSWILSHFSLIFTILGISSLKWYFSLA